MRFSARTTARNAILETRSASSSSDDFATEKYHETGTSRWGKGVPLHGCALACTSSSCSSNYEARVAGSSQEDHLVRALFSHDEALLNRKQTRAKVGEDHLVHILLVRHESLRKRKERALQASQLSAPTQQLGDFVLENHGSVMSPLVSPKKHDPSAYTDLYTAIDRSPGSPGSSCRSQVAAFGYKNHEFKKRDGNSITQLQADLLALFYECKNHGSIISPLVSRSSSPLRASSRVPSPCKNHISISSPAISRSSSPARPTCQNDDKEESPFSSPKSLGNILQVYNSAMLL